MKPLISPSAIRLIGLRTDVIKFEPRSSPFSGETVGSKRGQWQMGRPVINALRVTLTAVLGVALVASVGLQAAAAEDVPDQVLAWNQHAYNELVLGQGPFSVQHLAMVHGAIFDG
jgi:hypothetical protein